MTIIVVGILSRAVFHPFIISSLRYNKALRDLKPQLDSIKKKYGKDIRKVSEEQSKLFRASGVHPAAGAISCLSTITQIVVFIILYQALIKVISSGVQTSFLLWNLANPDVYHIQGVPIPIPGLLVILSAFGTLIQSQMLTPETKKAPPKKGEKGDISDDLMAWQQQTMFIFPIIILLIGLRFPAGLVLYWAISTLYGIIQQYQASGLGGLKLWLASLPIKK